MNILARLLGSEKVIDAGLKGIDSAFYTEQEQAEALSKRMVLKGALLRAYEPFKVAQRLLALLYGIPYVIAWFSMFIASFWVNVDQQFKFLVDSDMAMANLIILAFYFAGGAGESIFKYRRK